MDIISAKNIVKRFHNHTALDEVSISVREKSIFGLLGPNGAGKTTLIRIINQITAPDSGEIFFGGEKLEPRHIAQIGYLPEERGLYKKESVLDVMVYFGRLKGLSRKKAKDWSHAYLERVSLSDKATTRVDKLSGGQQQKIQLGVTIMNDPELLILDEPTQGFDPVNRRLLMDIIDDQKRAGATVIMVTHQMEEVERLCDRVLLLKDGTAEAYGTVEDVQDRYGATIIRVEHSGPIPASDLYDIVSAEHDHAQLAPRAGTDEADILRELVRRGVAVRSFTTARTSLQEIFLKIYGNQNELGA